MADDKPDENAQQGEFDFPSTDDFPSYDEVESEDGQAELPEDSFSDVGVNEDQEGCGCIK